MVDVIVAIGIWYLVIGVAIGLVNWTIQVANLNDSRLRNVYLPVGLKKPIPSLKQITFCWVITGLLWPLWVRVQVNRIYWILKGKYHHLVLWYNIRRGKSDDKLD